MLRIFFKNVIRMKPFLQPLITFVLFYAVLVSVMYISQRKLLYFPWKTRPSLGGLSGVYSEVQTQTEDQLTLTHWYAGQGPPYIVVFHGNAGNIEGRGYKFKFLVDQGYSVLLVSYRGYGDNPGQPTEQDFISDSSLALEWLFKQEGISSGEVVLFGESLGSGVAVALATQYSVRGLIFDGGLFLHCGCGAVRLFSDSGSLAVKRHLGFPIPHSKGEVSHALYSFQKRFRGSLSLCSKAVSSRQRA